MASNSPIIYTVKLCIKDLEELKEEIFERISNGHYTLDENLKKELSDSPSQFNQFRSSHYTEAPKRIWIETSEDSQEVIGSFNVDPSDHFFTTRSNKLTDTASSNKFDYTLTFKINQPDQEKPEPFLADAYTVLGACNITFKFSKITRELTLPKTKNDRLSPSMLIRIDLTYIMNEQAEQKNKYINFSRVKID